MSPQELDQARTAFTAAQAKLDALKKQVEAQRATVALARSNAEQVAVRRSQVQTSEHMQAAATAQRTKADVRLATPRFTRRSTASWTSAPRVGEVVSPGQPIVTLINPDDLWVRADVEESYIDRVRLGDTLTVRLPSGVEREGTVFYRGADAGVRDAARRQPHQARHQDVRGAAARGQHGPPAGRRHDGLRAAAGEVRLHVPAQAHERHRRPEHRQEVRRLHRRERHQLRRRGRGDLRPARAERRGQVDAHPHAGHAAAADVGHGARQRLRRREAGRRRAAVDRRDSRRR